MEPKTKQQIVTEATAYLNKTSLHLFMTGTQGHMYKITTFEKEGKLYYATIVFGKDYLSIDVKEAVSDKQYAWYGNNTLSVLKSSLFPTYGKTKSMPYFKKMRALVEEIMTEIKVDNASNKGLIEKMKAKLPELELIK